MQRFLNILALIALVLTVVGAFIVGFTQDTHADSQGYQSDQLMRRLVKAEEDQAKALQAAVRCLERMR